MKLPHRHNCPAASSTQLAVELGVEEVYSVAEPLWYLRLTGHFRLTWRREAATVATVFGLGLALGFLVGRL